MPMDLANLTIERIMVHVIFKLDENRQIVAPNYSTEFTTLSRRGLDTLQDRMVSALGSDSHGIELSIINNGVESTFQLAAKLVDADDESFIEQSKTVAHRLAEAQTSRRWPGGAVVVMRGTAGVNNNRFICVIKAETQEGFHNKQEPNKITMEFITDLLLTPQQKLYKIGMFVETNKQRPENGFR